MTKPNLDLFPVPDPPSTPPTWEDIERLAQFYPSARTYATLAECGDMTREQALISMVFWFATAFSQQFQREVDAVQREVLERVIKDPCGCSTATYVRRRSSLLACELHRAVDAVDPHVPPRER